MYNYYLKSNKKNIDVLVNRIRRASIKRSITLNNPDFIVEKNEVAILQKNKVLGFIPVSSLQEAKVIASSSTCTFKIGWDHNRNEKILVDFVS